MQKAARVSDFALPLEFADATSILVVFLIAPQWLVIRLPGTCGSSKGVQVMEQHVESKRGDSRVVAKKAGSFGAAAIGALAVGAFAIGALAIGRLAIGRLQIRRARIKSLEIGELTVKRLRVSDLVVSDSVSLPPK